jgi:hypothetical protein
MALGLSAGAITGLSLRGVIAAARAGVTMVAVPLVLLVATIGFSCGVAKGAATRPSRPVQLE